MLKQRKLFWILCLIVLIIVGISLLIITHKTSDMIPNFGLNTLTVKEGTEGSFEGLNIGVANIWDNSGRVVLSAGHETLNERVTPDSKLIFKNYEIKIIKIQQNTQPDSPTTTGGGNGFIAFKITLR